MLPGRADQEHARIARGGHARGALGARARVALGGLALLAACGGGTPARLEVTPSTVAAERSSNASIEARYQLRNGGDRPLLLDGVVPACGCRATARLPPALAPGATTSLVLGCRPSPADRRVVRDVHLRTSDPASPDVTVPLALQGVPAAAEPAAVYLGYVPLGGSATRDVVVKSAVAPAALSSPPPGFTIEALPARGDAPPGVRIRFAPSGPGVTRAVLDLGPAGTVTAVGIGYREVLAFPAELDLPAATGAVGLGGVTVMGLGADPLEITRVEYPPGLSGELRTVVPGRQFRLLLRSRGLAGGTASAAIRLHTDSSEEPVVIIPIAGAASERAGGPTS